MTRYAGDILDYMEIANLLSKSHGYFTLKGNEFSVLKTFAEDKSWFDGYDKFYGKKDVATIELTRLEPCWFDYVNNSMNPELFKQIFVLLLNMQEKLMSFLRIELKRLYLLIIEQQKILET